METKIRHVSELPTSTGVPKSVANPIKPERFVGTHQTALGKAAGLTQFGVNLVMLEPGSISSLRHWHEAEDEFVYVLEGEVVLVDDNGAHPMTAGMFVGFPANCENGHHLQNRSQARATMMVVGSRRPGQDVVHYPDDDLGPIRR